MMLLWKIRYLDRLDKQFKDRYLSLDTKTLDPVTRVAVELVVQNKSPKTERDILRYRRLFTEYELASLPTDPTDLARIIGGVSGYFEGETGKEITEREMGPIVTGSPTARLIPSGARQHDIDFMLSDPTPVPVAEITLTSEEVRLFGYFVRDLKELKDSAFMKDGPGTIKASGTLSLSASSNHTLETAVTDEEIRSFVTIFRRLYMTGNHDPASFAKVIPLFTNALGDHRYAKWVAGVAKEFKNHLDSVPDFRPFIQPGTITFTTKRLIDVFLYTQYAHQPNEDRQRQFGECLQQAHGKRPVLTWMFLTEIWHCSLEIGNAGRIISWWFQRYCDHHGVSPDILSSLRDDHSGLGVAEKEADRRARLFREKVEELAMDLWKQNGRPEGGPSDFQVAAEKLLSDHLRG